MMQLHTFEENERCVKIDVRQNTLLEDTYRSIVVKCDISVYDVDVDMVSFGFG